MSVSSVAQLFAEIFEALAKKPTPTHKAVALMIWPKRREFDFNEYDMDCDKALVRLGLAKDGGEDEYGEKVMLYREGKRWTEDP